LTPDDLGAVEALLREAARAEILPRFRRLSGDAVRMKSGALDLVTDADEAAERVIAAGLAARFPGALVLGEEAASREPALLERLAGAPLAFVVDPVDGTWNFAHGVPLFGVMCAALRDGETIAAWIHDPLGDDTAIAARGQGASLLRADGSRQALRAAAPAPLGEMIAAVSWMYLPEPRRSQVAARLTRLATTVQYRCAAHEYRLLAAGAIHGALYNKLMPWDHLPGELLLREAGGHAARFDGSAYRAGMTSGGLLCAPDAASWAALLEALLGEG
jgi:fructose-1,6-bisphosphatase/inositol monophosphatase family enzyme